MAMRDILFMGIILFVLGIGFFVIKFSSDTMYNALKTTPLNDSAVGSQAMTDTQNAVGGSDYLFLGVFIALALGIIITGWFISGEPIFMFFYFIGLIVTEFIVIFLANTWETVSTKSVFASTLASMPIVNHIISYLPIYMAVIGTIGMIVMFAKPSER